jgi:ketosteroid isomerase-like protein
MRDGQRPDRANTFSESREHSVQNNDPDILAVVARTDLWLQCAVDGQFQRLNDILSDTFTYASHPKFGAAAMDKAQMIEVASLLKDDGTQKLIQHVHKVGTVAVSITLTRSMERITAPLGAFASAHEMNASMNGKFLVYVSGWRKEESTWRCFDMHLVDALDEARCGLAPSELRSVTHADQDCQSVSTLTEEWLRCVAERNTPRIAQMLTADFVYSRQPRFGKPTLTNTELLELMSDIQESKASIVRQHLHRLGDIILAMNVTEAHQRLTPSQGQPAGQSANTSFLDKTLVDVAAWRQEDRAWRCFDYRLMEAL